MQNAFIRGGFALLLAAAFILGPSAVSLPTAVAAERSAPKIEIYTTSWCGYCKQAVAYFKAKRVPFTEYDVEKDSAAARRWQEISQGGGVPVVIVGKRVIRGYSREAFDRALAEEGGRP